MRSVGILLALCIAVNAVNVRPQIQRYTPDWSSLDTRPLPQWYDDAKIGNFECLQSDVDP